MRVSQEYKISDVNDVDFYTLLLMLKKNRRLIIGVGLLALVIAVSYAYFLPIKYQSSMLLQIQQKEQNVSTLPSINESLNSFSLIDEPITAQIALIKSPFILEPVIKSLGLDISVAPYTILPFNKLDGHYKNAINVDVLEVPASYLNQKLLLVIDDKQHFRLYNAKKKLILNGVSEKLIHKNLFSFKIANIKAPMGSQFVVIKKPASDIRNKILSHLSIVDLSNSAENSTHKIGILQISLIGNDAKLITTILNKLASVTQQKNVARKAIAAENKLTFLNQQIAITQKSLQESEYKLNHYRAISGQIDSKLHTSYLMTHLSDIDKQLNDANLKKSNMLQQYTQYHPFIISINQKIASLEKQKKLVFAQLKKLPSSDQVAATLARDVNVKNNLYTYLLNQIHELQVVKAGITSDVSVLLSATQPDRLQPVRLTIVAVVSLVIGLILGCLGVFMLRIISHHF